MRASKGGGPSVGQFTLRGSLRSHLRVTGLENSKRASSKDVDARDKPGHDEKLDAFEQRFLRVLDVLLDDDELGIVAAVRLDEVVTAARLLVELVERVLNAGPTRS